MQVQRTAVTEMLRPAEEALIEQKGVLECICMPPILASHAAGCDAVLAVLQGGPGQHLMQGMLPMAPGLTEAFPFLAANHSWLRTSAGVKYFFDGVALYSPS